MNPNSELAYQNVQEKIPEKQRSIVLYLRHGAKCKPRTGQEISRWIPGAWKRLADMERAGLIERCEERFCEVTGNMADTWRAKP